MARQLVEGLVAELYRSESDRRVALPGRMQRAHGDNRFAVTLLIKRDRDAEHAGGGVLVGTMIDLDQSRLLDARELLAVRIPRAIGCKLESIGTVRRQVSHLRQPEWRKGGSRLPDVRHFIYGPSAMPSIRSKMRRRDVLKALTGFAVTTPNVLRAQQRPRQRLVAMAFGGASDPDAKARIEAVQDGMKRLGWVEGPDLRYDYFFAGNNAQQAREISQQLLATSPDVILSSGTVPTAALHDATATVPIVFVNVTDPVAGGFVASLSRPGGNITGFTPFQYPIAGKWLELLREITPAVSRVALLGDPLNHNFRGFWAEFEMSASKVGVRAIQAPVSDAAEVERNIRAMAVEPNGGLIVTAAQFSLIHRELIINLAEQLKLPAVYWSRFFPRSGGLASYGPDGNELHRQSASYLDRILRGEKPENLPVQEAIKFETVLNLKTAHLLNLTMPLQMLARADEVIE